MSFQLFRLALIVTYETPYANNLTGVCLRNLHRLEPGMNKYKKVLVLAVVVVVMCVIYSLPGLLRHDAQPAASMQPAAQAQDNVGARNGADADAEERFDVDENDVVREKQGGNDVSHTFVRPRGPVHPQTIIANTSRLVRLFASQEKKGGHKAPTRHLQGAQTSPVYGPVPLGPNYNQLVKSAVTWQGVFLHAAKPFDKNAKLPIRSTGLPQNDAKNLGAYTQRTSGLASQNEQVVPVRDNDSFMHTNSTVGADFVAEADTDGNHTRRTIVYSCNASACGVGGPAEGVVSAYVLSVLMGRHSSWTCHAHVAWIPSWRPTRYSASQRAGLGKVDWRLSPQETEGRSVSHVHGVSASHIYTLVKRMLNQSDLNIAETDADYVFITWNMEVVHLLRTHSRAQRVPWLAAKVSRGQVYRHVLGLLMEPRPALQAQLRAVRSARPPDTRLACAHIRTGDSAALTGWPFFNTLDSLHVLFHFLQQFNDSQRYRVFFASDKQQVLAMARAQFPAVFLSTQGPVTHVDLDHSSDACAGLAHAILDQLVLATCDVLVLSRSGLSKIAAFLRNTDYALYLFHGYKITSYRRADDFGDRLW